MCELLRRVPGGRIDATYRPDKPLNGIIASLTALTGGQNLHKMGHVKVIISSVYDTNHAPDHIIEVGNDSITATQNLPYSWIGYDFGPSARIIPLSYTLKSRSNYDKWPNSPHSWMIETSLDGFHWNVVDWQINVKEVQTSLAVNHFALKRATEPCRYIRLTQTQKNQREDDHIVLAAFEVFGACYVEDHN